jgi:DNA repair protein RecO (recombination protein O)
MNIKTRGIVFHHIRYSDTSLIATIYTESSGRKSFLLKGIYKSKGLIKPGFFQPLSLLQLEISMSPRRELQRVKDAMPSPLLNHLYSNISKQSIVFFIAEILYKTVREEEPNPALFDFLYNSIQYLEASDDDIANFHLVFLLQLSRFLGFLPNDNYSENNTLFDTLNGCFVMETSANENTYGTRISNKFHELINLNFENAPTLKLNRIERAELLELILELYRMHLYGHLNIQSLQVLKELFD